MSSNFNFYLNRQGVRGPKGETGDTGFSPIISVKTDTANEYVLNIQNDSENFDTPNLRGSAISNLGGTYVRYDQSTGGMYAGNADIASTLNYGEVIFTTDEDLALGGDNSHAITSGQAYTLVDDKITEASVNYVNVTDYNSYVANMNTRVSRLENYKLDLEDFNDWVEDVYTPFTNSTNSSISSLNNLKLDTSDFNSYVSNTAITLDNLSSQKLSFSDLSNILEPGTNITITSNSATNKIIISSTGGTFTQVQSDWDETDPTDPSYILNKPTIPSVGDGTITFTQGGVTKGTITTNQSSNTTIELDAGGGSSITVDDTLSTSSTNPVQNAVITTAINNITSQIGDIETALDTINGEVVQVPDEEEE